MLYFLDQRRFLEYISPGDQVEGISRNRTHSDKQIVSNELPENILSENLGLDLVIAVTKTDYMTTLENEFGFREEHFDFIQQAIRKFCLQCNVFYFFCILNLFFLQTVQH